MSHEQITILLLLVAIFFIFLTRYMHKRLYSGPIIEWDGNTYGMRTRTILIRLSYLAVDVCAVLLINKVAPFIRNGQEIPFPLTVELAAYLVAYFGVVLSFFSVHKVYGIGIALLRGIFEGFWIRIYAYFLLISLISNILTEFFRR